MTISVILAAESVSDGAAPPWDGSWVVFMIGALLVFGGLLFFALRSGGRRTASSAPVEPLAPAPRHDDPTARDIAVAAFPHSIDAERAYARVRESNEGAEWLRDVAFAERHHHDRIGLRGVFAGHYLDIDDLGATYASLYHEVDDDLAGDGSAVLILAGTKEADAMADALGHEHGRLVRHRLSEPAAEALRAAVADAPPAA
jgi:hypothetical protein